MGCRIEPTGDHEQEVGMNVGGIVYTEKMGVLTQFPDSFLSAIFSEEYKDKICRDKNDIPFLDFNPVMFEHVLNWLRE